MLKRLGVSFEPAPPSASHPNRTDVACFVGRVARRRAPSSTAMSNSAMLQPTPEVLAQWLEDERFAASGTFDPRGVVVDLSSPSAFKGSLLAAHPAGRWPADIDAQMLSSLLAACRELSLVPVALVDELRRRGFYPGGLLGPLGLAGRRRVQELHNLPVAIETFEQFDALFAWDERPLSGTRATQDAPVVATALGAAVRAFFAEGGRKCYVVRTGDPTALFDTPERRFAAVAFDQRGGPAAASLPVLPRMREAFPAAVLVANALTRDPVTSDAAEWQGIEHVYGLPDVSFLCLPDVIDACAQPLPKVVAPAEVLTVEETFHECAEAAPREPEAIGRRLAPPRLGRVGLVAWIKLMQFALDTLDNGGRAFNRRDLQLIGSVPLMGEGRELPTPGDLVRWLTQDSDPADAGPSKARWSAITDARAQLGYPWLLTRDSQDCPGGVEAPEGTLAGILARSSLLQGSYRLAAHQPVTRMQDAIPKLDIGFATTQGTLTPLGNLALVERVCLLLPSPRGPELASDVTLAADPLLRPGSVRRLLNAVSAHARLIGAELAFDLNGEALWAQARMRLSDLGRALIAAGALSTDAGAAAFVVRCGRDTMTQNDIDAGRLIAEVELVPAQPITRILVVLALRDARAVAAAVRRAA
jgi:hypothetical protein